MTIDMDFRQSGVRIAVLCLASLLLIGRASGQVVKVDGTPTCYRALVQLSDEYGMNQPSSPKFEVNFGGSFAAVEKLGKGSIDIAFIEYPLRKHVDKAWAKAFPEGKAPPAESIFAQTALGVIVNKKNAITRLTYDQLRDIMTGKVTSWYEVGGSGQHVKVLTTKALSGSMVSDLLVNSQQWKGVKNLKADTNVIASVAVDPEAVGLVVLTPDLPKDVKLIAIAVDAKTPAVQPTVERIVLGEYPLVRQYKLLFSPDAPAAVRDFAAYACSENAHKTVQEWGLFPVAIRNKAEADKRLAEMKAGKGVRVSSLGIEAEKNAFQDIAVEYVRSRAVIQLGFAANDADVTSVGAFVTGGEGIRELLLLGDKPSTRAMELHGEKWNSLGVGKDGKPDGTGPKEYVLAGRAVAVIVNPANKLESLTVGQIQAIFQGDVDDWAVIGGTELVPGGGKGEALGGRAAIPINLFGLRAGGVDARSSAAAGVFHKEGVPADKLKRVTIKKDTAEAVAAVSMDPQAIAFVDLTAIPTSGQNVKVLAIRMGMGEKAKVIQPTAENIKNAMYPLSQRHFLYVHPKASDTAKDFAKFIATCGGSEATPYADTVKAVMETYQKHGLIPLADEAITRAAKDAMAEAAAKAKAEEAAKSKGKRK